MKNNNTLLTIASGALQAFGMWFFVLAVAVVAVGSGWAFSLSGALGLCAVAAICFRLADRWR